MPTYEYRCENGHLFEDFQSIVAEPVKICPQCGAPVERLISAGSGLIFKGSGFYITDYGRKNVGPSSPSHHGHSSSSSSENRNEKSEKSEKSEQSEKSEKSDSGAAKSDSAPKSDTKPTT
jgi:putative FmdB family regulatory protein